MSNMRARYHELASEQEEKTAQIVVLIDERSRALIAGVEFSNRSEIARLEYDITVLDGAITMAHELAEAEESSL